VADDLLSPGDLQDLGDLLPQHQDAYPLLLEVIVLQGWFGHRHGAQVHALLPARKGRDMVPDLLGREGEHGSQEPREVLHDQEQGALCRFALLRAGLVDIEPVLEDIEVEGAHVHHTEVVDELVDDIGLELLVGPAHLLDELLGHVQGVAVHLEHLPVRHHVRVRVESREVAEHEPGRVADAAVGLHQALDDFARDADVVPEVLGAHPEPEDLGAVFVDDLLGRDGVAQGLGHLAALAVHHKSVGEDGPVGRFAARAHRRQQRAVEPSPVLVRSLEVHVHRYAEPIIVLAHGGIAHARVEPHVNDVLLLDQVRARAGGACRPLGQQVSLRVREPGVRPLLLEDLRHVLRHGLARQDLAAVSAVEHRDGHTPGSLAGDAPVRPVFHHAVDAVPSPCRDPPHLLDGLQRLLAEVRMLHGDEPLVGGAEDDGALAPPAVGIRVLVIVGSEQGLFPGQGLVHVRVGVEHEPACKLLHLVRELALVVHRCIDVEAVDLADLVVLLAVARGDVHAARSRIQRDEGRQDQERLPVVERVPRLEMLHDTALEGGQDLVVLDADLGHDRGDEFVGHDQHAVPVRLHRGVIELRVEGDGQVGRDGPGRGGPDDHVRIFLVVPEPRDPFRYVRDHLEAHEDGRRGLVVVFDLRLGQRRLARGAPVHRLSGLVQGTLADERAQLSDDGGLVPVGHGHIRVLPQAEHAEALEFLTLDVEIFSGILPAVFPDLGLGHAADLLAHGYLHLVFDGKPVAVPPGKIERVVTHHEERLDDDVLEDLVQRGAEVNVPVGVRRAVMEDELGSAGRGPDDLVVELLLFPAFEDLGLLLDELRLHGKCGVRQTQCFLVIHAILLVFSSSVNLSHKTKKCQWPGREIDAEAMHSLFVNFKEF